MGFSWPHSLIVLSLVCLQMHIAACEHRKVELEEQDAIFSPRMYKVSRILVPPNLTSGVNREKKLRRSNRGQEKDSADIQYLNDDSDELRLQNNDRPHFRIQSDYEDETEEPNSLHGVQSSNSSNQGRVKIENEAWKSHIHSPKSNLHFKSKGESKKRLSEDLRHSITDREKSSLFPREEKSNRNRLPLPNNRDNFDFLTTKAKILKKYPRSYEIDSYLQEKKLKSQNYTDMHEQRYTSKRTSYTYSEYSHLGNQVGRNVDIAGSSHTKILSREKHHNQLFLKPDRGREKIVFYPDREVKHHRDRKKHIDDQKRQEYDRIERENDRSGQNNERDQKNQHKFHDPNQKRHEHDKERPNFGQQEITEQYGKRGKRVTTHNQKKYISNNEHKEERVREKNVFNFDRADTYKLNRYKDTDDQKRQDYDRKGQYHNKKESESISINEEEEETNKEPHNEYHEYDKTDSTEIVTSISEKHLTTNVVKKDIGRKLNKTLPIWSSNKHKKGNMSPLRSDAIKSLYELAPHSIAKQLRCLKKDLSNAANIKQEIIGHTVEYNDIVLWKIEEKDNGFRKVHFRASNKNKYADEKPEKKIVLIVHGLSVMGWNDLDCLSKVKRFKTLVGYYLENLDTFDIFLIPMANPDGVTKGTVDGWWNKNMSPQAACPGVNLDRNFDVAWNSSIPQNISSCSQNYPGPRPFSEHETRAIRDIFKRFGHKIVAYFHVHAGSYDTTVFKGDAILYPKGYMEQNSDDEKYIDLKGEIDETMRNSSFKILTVTMDTLYNWYGKTHGSSVDFASTVYGIPYCLELVMQLYEDSHGVKESAEREKNAALTELWQNLIDVIFDHIYKSAIKTEEL